MNWNNIDQQSIVLKLESSTKTDAIRELLRKAPALKKIRDLEALEQAILSREKVMTTGIGRGVAISHGEVPEFPSVLVVLGLSHGGIEFDSVDGQLVHILFVIVNSKLKRAEYLEALSTLTKLMRSDDVRHTMRSCTCSLDVRNALHAAFHRMQMTA